MSKTDTPDRTPIFLHNFQAPSLSGGGDSHLLRQQSTSVCRCVLSGVCVTVLYIWMLCRCYLCLCVTWHIVSSDMTCRQLWTASWPHPVDTQRQFRWCNLVKKHFCIRAARVHDISNVWNDLFHEHVHSYGFDRRNYNDYALQLYHQPTWFYLSRFRAAFKCVMPEM